MFLLYSSGVLMASVTSLNTLTGAVTLLSAGNTITITNDTLLKQINLEANFNKINPAQTLIIHQDYAGDNGVAGNSYAIGTQGNGSSGAVVSYNNSNVMGVLRLTNGVSASTGVMEFCPADASTFIRLGAAKFTYRRRCWFTSLSIGTNRYYARMGIGLRVYSGETTGVYFRYTDNVNSGKYVCVVRNGASESSFNTTVTPSISANAPDVLSFVANNTGTAIDFYINGVFQTTITTNIPTTTSMQLWAQINTVSGGQGGSFDTDYTQLEIEYNRS